MIKRLFFLLALSAFPVVLSACGLVQNGYRRETYTTTDSYGSAFEGQRVPQNVR